MNHRGVIAKASDFLILVVGALFFFLIIGFFLTSSINTKNERTISETIAINKVYNVILENRIIYEEGQNIDFIELRRQLQDLQEIGFVSSPDQQEQPGGMAEI